jgi:hypothetical protein
MQFTDCQGFVIITTGTDVFTGMMANPPADTGERVVLFEQL